VLSGSHWLFVCLVFVSLITLVEAYTTLHTNGCVCLCGVGILREAFPWRSLLTVESSCLMSG